MKNIFLPKIQYKLVIIEWVDSLRCSPNWEEIDNLRTEPTKCISIGFLVNNSKAVKTLYPHIGLEDEWTKESGLGGINIPTKSIISIKEILFNNFYKQIKTIL